MEKITDVTYRLKRVHRGSDAVWRISIIIRHHHDTIIIPTELYATDIQLTSNNKLGNGPLMAACRKIMRKYQRRLETLRLDTYDLNTKTVAAILRGEENVNIDFMNFFRKWMLVHTDQNLDYYRSAYKSLARFIGGESLSARDMSMQLLRRYELSLAEHPSVASMSVFCIRHVFKDMRRIYNDFDDGIPVIKRNLDEYKPAIKYVHGAQGFALTVEQLRKIATLPDTTLKGSLFNIARDAFLISFMTMGMTGADLYECEYDEDGYIVFEKARSRHVRDDRGVTRIKPHPLLEPYLRKYGDNASRRKFHRKVFCFHRIVGNRKLFVQDISRHMPKIGEAIGVQKLTFACARHSMIDIALYDVGISKECLLEMLNLRVLEYHDTDKYLHITLNDIQNENHRLIDYVFGGGEQRTTRSSVTVSGEGGRRSVIVDELVPLVRHEVGLRYLIIPQDQHADGTWTAHIRMTFRDEEMDIPTNIRVDRRQIDTEFYITDEGIIDRLMAVIQDIRQKTDAISLDEVDSLRSLLILLAGKEKVTENIQ